MALLYPLVYLQSQRRLDALSSALYYAGATWSVIPGSESFFGTAGIRLPSQQKGFNVAKNSGL
jgi:hypothetical protein